MNASGPGARRAALVVLGSGAATLAGCISASLGGEPALRVQLALRDAASAPVQRLPQPLVAALLVQPQPAGALADTQAIAYSRRAGEYASYQLATWTERPVRSLPRLLQQRLQARGVAAAVGAVGDPMRADWMLAVGVDTLYHDLTRTPSAARLDVTADLFDRRTRARVAQRRFTAEAPAAREDSAAFAEALSTAVARLFDDLVPWLEAELTRVAG